VEETIDISDLKFGDVLIKTKYISVDPVMRVWLSGAETYFPALKINDVMHSFGVGEVVKSKGDYFVQGDWVIGNLGI